MFRLFGAFLAVIVLVCSTGTAFADDPVVIVDPIRPGMPGNPATFGTTLVIGNLEITVSDLSIDKRVITVKGNIKSTAAVRKLPIANFYLFSRNESSAVGSTSNLTIKDNDDQDTLNPGDKKDFTVVWDLTSSDTSQELIDSVYRVGYQYSDEDGSMVTWQKEP